MANLLNQIKARLENSEFNQAFNERVQPTRPVTQEEKDAYQQAHESFQEYKENKQ